MFKFRSPFFYVGKETGEGWRDTVEEIKTNSKIGLKIFLIGVGILGFVVLFPVAIFSGIEYLITTKERDFYEMIGYAVIMGQTRLIKFINNMDEEEATDYLEGYWRGWLDD